MPIRPCCHSIRPSISHIVSLEPAFMSNLHSNVVMKIVCDPAHCAICASAELVVGAVLATADGNIARIDLPVTPWQQWQRIALAPGEQAGKL